MLADLDLHDRVRCGPSTRPIAAVFEVPSLPVDRRHNSKIDRSRLGCVGRGAARRRARIVTDAVKVLVTGGDEPDRPAHRRRACAERGDDVTTLQRGDDPGDASVRGSVTDRPAVADACTGQDAVIHLAAKVGVTGDMGRVRADERPRHRTGPRRRSLTAAFGASSTSRRHRSPTPANR